MCGSFNSVCAALSRMTLGMVGRISARRQVQTLNLSTWQALSSHVHPSVGTYATKLLEGQPYQAGGGGLRDVAGVSARPGIKG